MAIQRAQKGRAGGMSPSRRLVLVLGATTSFAAGICNPPWRKRENLVLRVLFSYMDLWPNERLFLLQP